MAKAKVSIDFSTHNFNDKELNVKASSIVDGLADNPGFPSLKESSVQIKAKNDYYGGLLAKMELGNRQITAEKNVARIELEGILKTTGLKVQDLSNGEEVLILSTGFDINRKPTPVGILNQPVNLQIKLGKITGTLEVSWDVVPGAYSYEIRYTQMPKTDTSIYNNITSTKRKIMLENLTPGQTYSIQVAGVGSDPKRVWSVETVSCYVS